MTVITEIDNTSPFYGLLRVGDELKSVNGKEVEDILDYMYETASERVTLRVEREGKELEFSRSVDAPLGISYEPYLMSKQRSCKNKCVFCFIDQLPKGMRDTLYFKDDDFRLSVLYGNYVTLTNASDDDIKRIARLHLPMNISVHTTDPELRVRMMKNPNAAKINEILRYFADSGVIMRCQIVLCKGFNDGENLIKTVRDLYSYYPAVTSVSVVPFGATSHRDGLCPIEVFTEKECSDIIDTVSALGDEFFSECGDRFVYEADEFYVKAGRQTPETEHYGEFEQIENGVGMISLFREEFEREVKSLRRSDRKIDISLASGMATKDVFPPLLSLLKTKLTGLDCKPYFIKNNFFGETVTVAGLVTGSDLISQLRGKNLGETLLIPENMLRDGKFLDDVTVEDAERELNIKIKETPCDAKSFIDTVKGLSY